MKKRFFTSIAITILLLSSQLHAKGLLISCVGISGSGKTTVFEELHKLIPGAKLIAEPKADKWPESANQKTLVGQFTFLTTFRNMWDTMIKKAALEKGKGHIVLVDHYYLKIWSQFIGRPHTDWIISAKNPYFTPMKKILELDEKSVPDPDVLVVFDLDFQTYQKHLRKRGRWLDKNRPYKKIYRTLSYIKEAASKLEREGRTKIVHVFQKTKTPHQQAISILEEIRPLLEKQEA